MERIDERRLAQPETPEQYQLRLLKMALLVIMRTPEEVMYLNSYKRVYHCRTLHCAAGHLTLDPEFRALGLRLFEVGGSAVPVYEDSLGHKAMDALFKDEDAFFKYFETYGNGKWDESLTACRFTMSDKQLALARLHRGIKELEDKHGTD